MARTTNCLFRQPGKCGTDIEWNGILQNTSKDKQFKTAGQFLTFCKVNVVITNYAKFSDLQINYYVLAIEIMTENAIHTCLTLSHTISYNC